MVQEVFQKNISQKYLFLGMMVFYLLDDTWCDGVLSVATKYFLFQIKHHHTNSHLTVPQKLNSFISVLKMLDVQLLQIYYILENKNIYINSGQNQVWKQILVFNTSAITM
jgi:hypothetical protein